MFGVCGPRGMPEHVVNRLEDVFSRAIKDPDFTKFMKMMNMPISYMNRVEFNKYIQTKFRETGELVKKLD
jgi:tripartite-type tricarboxylate transporter receptor subunit TctC